jgi:phenylacetate-CoA ligase
MSHETGAFHEGKLEEMPRFHSQIPGIDWPAIPRGTNASLLAVLLQLERSQWWSAERVQDEQLRQLQQLVMHAAQCVPFYQQRLTKSDLKIPGRLTPESWRNLPLLTRRDVQVAGPELHAANSRADHGRLGQVLTSGSTGQPVQTLTTDVTRLFWKAFTLRDHLWHRPECSGTLAAVRDTKVVAAVPPHGVRSANWGPATAGVLETGPSALLSIQTTVQEQWDWLKSVEPASLLTYPTTVMALAQWALKRKETLPGLREVRTFGEILDPRCRELCRAAWDVAVVDMYSSQEVGYIALQCPEFEHYHVQAENVLLEVLREDGNPCGIGETGRVVLTPLHNFAMPLLRYDVGDYAEIGPPCLCGRGLPVLKRILGRQRNLVTFPDGTQHWPTLVQGQLPESLPPVYQFQLVQRSLVQIELRVVRHAPFTADETERMIEYLHQTLRYPFEISIHYVDEIPRSPTGKYEEFRSELALTLNG